MRIIRKIYNWCTKTRLRKILSLTLAILIFLTSIKYIFTPVNPVKAADVYLGFDEGYGTSSAVHDANNTVSAGSITNATWKQEEFCKVGKCLYFDGTGDYVSFADDSDLDFAATDNFTIEGWFRTPDTSAQRTLIAKYNSTAAGYKVYMDANGYIVFGADYDATWTPTDSASTSTTAFDDNKWHFFSAVKTGTTSMIIYVDGIAYQTDSSITNSTLVNADSFYIGIDGDGSSNGYTGFIDDVRVLRSARTAAEIKADFTGQTQSRGSSASFGSDQSWLTNGLVGYWKMDESAANGCGTDDSCDASGNNNNLAWNGGATSASGKFGNGVTLDGTGDYLSDAISPSLSGSSFTVSGWVYQNSGADDTWFSLGNNYQSNQNLHLSSFNSGAIRCGFYDNDLDTSTGVFQTGGWHHVACTYDSVSNKRSIFYDGNLIVSDTASSDFSGNNNLLIGQLSSSTNEWTGKLDGIRIYNRYLSPYEVQSLYNWAPGPVAYYKFDENTGTSIFDSSGNGNNSASTNGSPKFVTGKYGSASNINGGYFQVTNSNSIGNQPAYSWSFWAYPTITSSDVIDKRADSVGWGIALNSNKWQFTVDYSTTDLSCTGPTLGSTQNTWQHVEITWDGTSTCSGVKLYKNGVPQTWSSTTDSSGTRQSDAVTNLRIGGNGYTNMTGYLDDFKIYNYARTSSQVAQDTNSVQSQADNKSGNPLGYWNFDEGADNTCSGGTNDICNTGTGSTTLDGTNSATWTSAGKTGKSLSFNGLEYAQIADNSLIDFTDDFTLSAWVSRAGGTNGYIISKTNDSSDGGFALLHGTNGEVYCRTNNGTSSTDSYTTTGLVNTDSVWHHVAAVRSGTSCRVYVDGVDRTSTTGTHTTLTANANNLRFGSQPSGANYFNGNIDEVKIYNYALNASQIRSELNQGSSVVMGAVSTNSTGAASWSATDAYCPPGQGSSCTAPVSHWKFDENNLKDNASATIFDSTGNNNLTTNRNSGLYPVNTVGKIGSAFNPFMGTNDHNRWAGITDDADLDITGAITISAWIKISTISGCSGAGRTVLAKGQSAVSITDSTLLAYRLAVACTGGSQANGVQFLVSSDGTDDAEVSSGNNTADPTITANNWYHFTGVYDGTNILAYLNGKLFSSTAYSSGIFNSSADFRIGGMQYAGGGGHIYDFPGQVDDVRIYGYARTPAQIAWEYNRGGPGNWYQMDESLWNGTASEVKDASGRNLHGVRAGDATTSSSGKINNAGSFDGTGDYVTVASPSLPTTDFTYAAWVNPTSNAAQQTIVMSAESTSGDNEMKFEITSAGKLGFVANGGSNDITSNLTLSANTWTHVAVTRSSGTLKLYINGVADSATGSDSTTLNHGTCSLLIGTDADSATSSCTASLGEYMNGKIDDLRIFGYALNETQIKIIMNDNSAVKFTQ